MIKKKRVYIIHPYSDRPEQNVKRVAEICRRIKHDVYPIAPHLSLPQFINEDTERLLALDHGIAMLKLCDEAWICSSYTTPGMDGEISYADRKGIKVFDESKKFEDIK
jgi:hypothetical protein